MRLTTRHLLLLSLLSCGVLFWPAVSQAQVGDPHVLSQPGSPVEPEVQPMPVKPYPTPTPKSDADDESASPTPTPLTTGHETHLIVEPGVRGVDVTGNPTRFYNFRDWNSGFWLERFLYTSQDRQSPWYLKVNGWDLGLRDANVGLTTGSWNGWRFSAGFDNTPRVYSDTAQTIYQIPAPGIFTLSGAQKSAFAAAGADPVAFGGLVNSLLVPVSLGYDYSTYSGGLSYDIGPWTAVGVGYSQIRRSGTQPVGTTFFFNNEVELPAPMNDTTSRTEVAASYGQVGNDLSFDAWSDDYRNNIGFLSWANPATVNDSTLNGPAIGVGSTAPSNHAWQASLAGGLNLGRVRVTGYASQGAWEQHDGFLPQTSNTAIGAVANPLPIGPNLPGNVSRDMEDFNASARLSKNLSVKGYYRHYEVDDSTPSFLLPAGSLTIADTILFDQNVQRTPYGFATTDYGADLTWHVLPTLNTNFGYRHETWNRVNRDVNQTDEHIWSVATDWHPNRRFSLDARWENGSRSIGFYTPFVDESLLLRNYDEAARSRQEWHVKGRWDPNERMEVYGEFNSLAHTYPQTVLGLTSDSQTDYSVGMSYAFSQDFSAYLDYSSEAWQANQASQFRTIFLGNPTNDPLDNWFSAGQDNDDVFSIGCNWRLPHKWTLDASYLITDGTGIVNAFGIPGGNASGEPLPWPNVNYNLNVFRLVLSRNVDLDTKLKFIYRLEDYRQNDFATDAMVPFMGFTDPEAVRSVFLGAQNGSYRANVFGVQISRRY